MVETTVTTPRKLPDGGIAYRLLVVRSPSSQGGEVLVLGSDPVQLGRSAQPGQRCFVLDHPEISRAHARVERTSDGLYAIHDLGSHNGTFVNARRIDRHQLTDGDVVRIGSHLLLFQRLTTEECELLLHRERWPAGALVGSGARMLRVRKAIAEGAKIDGPVLVTGESGVGKELVAGAIHAQSGRTGRFVAVNCAALPETLIESELFGHARGAFTGAGQANPGLFEEAEGGTLLLDEIGDMPLELQAKLLRALATGEVRAVGTSRTRQVDVKLVAATNVALDVAVSDGTFRGDLYSRLLGFTIEVPPLRRRREDILELTCLFLKRIGVGSDIDSDTAEALLVHDWPFNVRELEQTVSTAGRLGDGSGLRLQTLVLRKSISLPAPTDTAVESDADPLRRIVRDAVPSKADLETVLLHFEGNVIRVAAFFGRHRRLIYRWCDRYGIKPDRFR